MKTDAACACEVDNPRVITNPFGLSSVRYRVGDFTSFRHALLKPLPNEVALAVWNPTASGDLAVQLVEWWAYLADVLTFYNERAFNESLLRTAMFSDDIRRIVRLLGYRPRPGIGATGVLAAEISAPAPFTLERGFEVEGTAPSGHPRQVFELDADTELGLLGRALPPSARLPSIPGASGSWSDYVGTDVAGQLVNDVPAQLLQPQVDLQAGTPIDVGVDGVIASLKTEDVVLFVRRGWSGHDDSGWAEAVVQQVQPTWDAHGSAITSVTIVASRGLADFKAANYRMLRSSKFAHLWLYHERYLLSPSAEDQLTSALSDAVNFLENPLSALAQLGAGPPPPPEDPRVITEDNNEGVAHLEAITRAIRAGDIVLFQQTQPGHTVSRLVTVTGYSEEIWYANPPEASRIGVGPPVGPPSGGSSGLLGGLLGGGSSPPAPIPIPHTKIRFTQDSTVKAMGTPQAALSTVVVHYDWQDVGDLVAPPPVPAKSATTQPTSAVPGDAPPLPVLIQDPTGNGVPGVLGQTVTGDLLLHAPLRALLHLLPVSRGQTVEREVLGSGDPTVAWQEMALAQSPLTYLADTGPTAINGYRSTLRVWVDGVEWQEVDSFFQQEPDAQVFVTREDDDQITHVRFGDGSTGARLTAGVDNVIAQYRYGSGAELPAPRSLTTMLRPNPSITRLLNPVPVGGGADPDPADQLRRYAPRSVLTFNRAVSGDDYETLAAQTPGVVRARAQWSWDARAQRTLVKVFVGDDAAAVAAARSALRRFADPNRPILVAQARAISIELAITVEVDSSYEPGPVRAAVEAALLDPQNLPFGSAVAAIGRAVYDSQIYDLCLGLAGVVAVRGLEVPGWNEIDERHSPGEDGYFTLAPGSLNVTMEVATHV